MSQHTFRTPPRLCPKCGDKLDAVTNLTRNQPGGPDPGSVSMCINCGAVLMFGEGLTLREMTHPEIGALPEDALFLLAQMQIARRNIVGKDGSRTDGESRH